MSITRLYVYVKYIHIVYVRYNFAVEYLGLKNMGKKKLHPKSKKRRDEIIALRKTGLSYEKIGNKYSLTRERIRQILLPIKTSYHHRYKCSKCNYELVRKRKRELNCPNCFLKREKERNAKSIYLNQIFSNEPAWRQEGRERIRMMVRYRDNFTCQSCHKKWKKGMRHFDVHHLNGLCGKKSKGYDSVLSMNGLITLCHKCHYNHPEHSSRLKI